jgi:hypothetical protein
MFVFDTGSIKLRWTSNIEMSISNIQHFEFVNRAHIITRHEQEVPDSWDEAEVDSLVAVRPATSTTQHCVLGRCAVNRERRIDSLYEMCGTR